MHLKVKICFISLINILKQDQSNINGLISLLNNNYKFTIKYVC